MNSASPSRPPANLTLCELADGLARGEFRAVDALRQYIERAQAAHAKTNAVAVWRIDEAMRDAEAADQALQAGNRLGPLHGVPMSIKECFDLTGTPSTMGLPSRAKEMADEDGEMVRRLRAAGAVIFAKTNVPQLMFSHETNNPLYGRSTNPWDASRTPGGSSGGEAALIAAGGSPGGLGSDLGGSIRVPAHFCGITGIKPTSGRLPRHGGIGSMRGLDAVQFQPGPMARTVDDVGRILQVICDPTGSIPSLQTPPLPLAAWESIDLKGHKIGYFTDDRVFKSGPAVVRAVLEARDHLKACGAELVEFQPEENFKAFELFLRAVSADGAADHLQFVKGNPREPSVNRLLWLMSLPLSFRKLLAAGLSAMGDHWLSRIVTSGGGISTAEYWKLTREIQELSFRCMDRFRQSGLSALIFPVYALPAIRHGDAMDALPAASYAIFPNVLGTPCGALPVTTVRKEEEPDYPPTRDSASRAAVRAETASAGLPIGVQVMTDYWREDLLLAVMKAIESRARNCPNYPIAPY